MKSDPKKLLEKNDSLNHLEMQKVESHRQRRHDDWFINTLMLEGYDVPFKYRRKKEYKCLKGAMVNLTYYPQTEKVAGLDFETMKVVRVRVA